MSTVQGRKERNPNQAREYYDLSDKNFLYRIFNADFPPYDAISDKRRKLHAVGLVLLLLGACALIGVLLGQTISRLNDPPVIVSGYERQVPFSVPAMSVCVLNNTSRGSPGKWLLPHDAQLTEGNLLGSYLLNASEVRTCNQTQYSGGGGSEGFGYSDSINCSYAIEPSIYVPSTGGAECILFNTKGQIYFSTKGEGIYLSLGMTYTPRTLRDTFANAPRDILPPVVHLGLYKQGTNPEYADVTYGAPGQLNNLVFSSTTYTTLAGSTNYSYPLAMTSVPYVQFDRFNQGGGGGCAFGKCVSVIYIFIQAQSYTIQNLTEQKPESVAKLISYLGGALSLVSFAVFFLFGILLPRIFFKDRRAYVPYNLREEIMWLSRT